MFENPRRQAGKKFYDKCSENSRSQIVFRTDIFQKLSLGAPDETLVIDNESVSEWRIHSLDVTVQSGTLYSERTNHKFHKSGNVLMTELEVFKWSMHHSIINIVYGCYEMLLTVPWSVSQSDKVEEHTYDKYLNDFCIESCID